MMQYSPMRRATITTCVLSTAILAISLASAARAQTPATPDFSGTWKLNPAKSKSANTGFTGAGTMTVQCSGQTIQVHFASPGHDSTRTFVVDGKEHYADKLVSGSMQVLSYSKAVWEGSTLVIESRAHTDDPDNPTVKTPDTHAAQRWALSHDGRVLTLSSIWSGSDAALNSIVVYDKQ
jgi:membrane-bound inhibitor of C-type lysozyme